MPYGPYELKCPVCKCRNVERIHRSTFEKICRRNPKFRCYRCSRNFFSKILPQQSVAGQTSAVPDRSEYVPEIIG